MVFENEIFVNFDLADPAGVIFYPNIFKISHQCIEQLITQSPVGWENWFQNKNFAAPITKAQVQFLKPIIAGRYYLAKVWVYTISTTTVGFQSDFYENDILCAQVQSAHTFISKKESGKIPIPETIRTVLNAYTLTPAQS